MFSLHLFRCYSRYYSHDLKKEKKNTPKQTKTTTKKNPNNKKLPPLFSIKLFLADLGSFILLIYISD